MTKARWTREKAWSVTLVAAVAACLALASSASASGPTGAYEVFKNCPYESSEVKQCVYSETTGGEVILGKETVPIVNKILLQGGSKYNFETEIENFYAAKTGETLQAVAQPVPDGLLGLFPESAVPWWLRPAYKAVLGVNAITQLAKAPTEIGINSAALVEGEGVALKLPVKVRLENLFLGSSCYVGSASSPITWNLTTGTTAPPSPNKPITGSTGVFKFTEDSTILTDEGNKLVDNAFSAPAASGCGGLFSIIINPILNAKIGLPSAAGNNTAILSGNLKRGYAPAVKKSAE